MIFLDIDPETCDIDDQAYDCNREEFQLEVGPDYLKKEADLGFDQHPESQEFLQHLLLLLSKLLAGLTFEKKNHDRFINIQKFAWPAISITIAICC